MFSKANRRELLIGVGAVILDACSSKVSVPKETLKTKEKSGFEPGSIWRLNQGPHDDPEVPEGQRIWYSIDIGIPEIINADGGPRSGYRYEFTALKEGKVFRIDKEHGTIHKGKTEYEGAMVKDNGEKRNADLRICFPSKENPIPCERNENGEIINNGIKTPIEFE